MLFVSLHIPIAFEWNGTTNNKQAEADKTFTVRDANYNKQSPWIPDGGVIR